MPVSKEQIQVKFRILFFCCLTCHRLAFRERSFTVCLTLQYLVSIVALSTESTTCSIISSAAQQELHTPTVLKSQWFAHSCTCFHLWGFLVGLFLCPAFSLIQSLSLSLSFNKSGDIEAAWQSGMKIKGMERDSPTGPSPSPPFSVGMARLGAGVQACVLQLSEI